MYGLVNKAVQDLVCSRFGEDTWQAIKRKANVDDAMFVSMEAYPDQITYNLVGAASEVLGASPDDILKAFGEHWILFTAREGYGDLLRMGGASFLSFVQNLDNLHARVGLSFPELRPPEFRCTDIERGSVRLHYFSSREGLTAMVVGLLNGLGKMFNTELSIEHVAKRSEGAGHDEFLIRWNE
jgi:hypothetical protein